MDFQKLLEPLKRSFGRVARSDFGRDSAAPEEREALASGPARITRPLAQDYAAWRGSVLFLAACVMVVGVILRLLNFQSFSDGLDPMAIQGIGEGNLDTLDLIHWTLLLSTLATTGLVVFSALKWTDQVRSGRMALIGWLIMIGAPLVLALLPWSRMLSTDHLHLESDRESLRGMVGLILGMQFFFILAPKLLAIFPGIIRASVTLKTMLHESPAPGYIVVLFAPFYAMFVLVVFTTINQMQGNLILLAGIGCLVVAPLVYLWRAKDFLRPHSAEESQVFVRGVRKQA